MGKNKTCINCKIKKEKDFDESDCRFCDDYVIPEYCEYCGYIFDPKEYIENGYRCYMCTEGE